MPRLCSSLLLSLLIASAASAVSMAWTPVGNPGNACDPQSQGCFGAVPYSYYIGTYEVTNAQYAEFLNAKAATDLLGLYNPNMANTFQNTNGYGGITRSGASGSYTYSAIAGRENVPVNWVSFYDSLRFANWMNNGQGAGDTENGTYTLIGGTATPSNGTTVSRNPGATMFLASEDEWYKAAYYDATLESYFRYPARSDLETACTAPTATANRANCGRAVGDLTNGGSYSGSASPYGTFDQGGNVWELNEAIIGSDGYRGARGGAFDYPANGYMAGVLRSSIHPTTEFWNFGFRLAMIPEPSTDLLVIAGLLGLAGWRRARA